MLLALLREPVNQGQCFPTLFKHMIISSPLLELVQAAAIHNAERIPDVCGAYATGNVSLLQQIAFQWRRPFQDSEASFAHKVLSY